MKPDRNQKIYERDKFTCQYCGLDASKNFETWWTANLNIDHIKPRVHGGDDKQENLVVACRACNNYKGSANCNTVKEGRDIIVVKREEARRWFKKYVLKDVE